MNDSIADKLTLYRRRQQALNNERSTFISHWQELSKFFLPRSGRFVITDRNKGDKRYNNIIDNTGTKALRTQNAGLMSGMTSPARPWVRLTTRDRALMQYQPVKRWLDDTTEVMLNIFNVSNTYRVLPSLYGETGLYGAGCTLLLDDFDDIIRHYPLTVGEYAIAINNRNEVDTLVREYQMSVSQIVREFIAPTGDRKRSGTWDWSLASAAVKNLYDAGNLDATLPVSHIIEPREDREPGNRTARNMPFASCYFESAGANDRLLRESGFMRFPALVPRWDALGGDAWGTNCPGMESLGDVKQLQHGQTRKIQGIDYLIKPPLQIPRGTKNHEIDTLPGGVIPVDMTNNAKIQTAFDVKVDISGQLEDIRDVRQRIRESFSNDLFLMISGMEGVQPRNVEEIVERKEEKLLMLGPVVERLHNEILKPKIDITFARMLATGIVPPPPPEMHGQALDVQFISVLAQAQRMIGISGMDRFTMQLGVIAQTKPGVLDKFNEDTWADRYADALGVDPDMIVGNAEVALIRQQKAQAAQQQQQLAAMQQMAETAKTASQADTSGRNALTDVMRPFSGYQ